MALGHQVIYMDPAKFMPEVGHFDSLFCWCGPHMVDYTDEEGQVSKQIGHSNIKYYFSGGMKHE